MGYRVSCGPAELSWVLTPRFSRVVIRVAGRPATCVTCEIRGGSCDRRQAGLNMVKPGFQRVQTRWNPGFMDVSHPGSVPFMGVSARNPLVAPLRIVDDIAVTIVRAGAGWRPGRRHRTGRRDRALPSPERHSVSRRLAPARPGGRWPSGRGPRPRPV